MDEGTYTIWVVEVSRRKVVRGKMVGWDCENVIVQMLWYFRWVEKVRLVCLLEHDIWLSLGFADTIW